ncbi:bifunctional phosphoribosyl-AMP cyclohydrolase/phosphoribosyl-ATP diphosphatase HisIE [Dethiobacter alkaliphilus]|uniref:bifunctional phosphoribosyl-AMP cyclohydrolase/phosphoribosyl-ATP diphosphatase HisIE n=1 Tax=Dethiobacter alkaliphilus TaxID=427926 RepID=UPI00222764F7|nr:bifunctional phosphoribosyl-AMP cyclohydrolase/phosphoribosyl-ATP diphosphatase HisIE [Dethiobacter alkaliphilus]MCW3491286.1 bifunctional phosphoribosyl-AMP cyclohydrolase/phosphoribosyl-ATP diphosphatase HisIE [Dethiobacter alkaliphilus]
MITNLKFDQNGLIPAVVQDAETGRVLMLAYMNEESLKKTVETGETWFFSRSRNELWHKGATSGHIQKVRRIDFDCDKDALLVQVEQTGAACHTGAATCFYQSLSGAQNLDTGNFLPELERIIAERKVNKPEGSYVAKLFDKGLDRILKKVGEEAGEVIIAAKNEDRNELIYESGDLIFHLLVLLAEKDVAVSEVLSELARRHRPKPAEGQ